jgi:hypothetical protein
MASFGICSSKGTDGTISDDHLIGPNLKCLKLLVLFSLNFKMLLLLVLLIDFEAEDHNRFKIFEGLETLHWLELDSSFSLIS